MSASRPNIGHLIGLVAILKPATGLGSSWGRLRALNSEIGDTNADLESRHSPSARQTVRV